MPAPYSVLSCRHLLTSDGPRTPTSAPGAAGERRDGAGVTGTVTLPDGRELAYEEYGDPAGFPVLSFHGGLSSRLDAAPAHEAAVAMGVRLVSPDRPGMGLSTYQPGRRLLDWPADVEHLADALGIGRFAVMGWSAGGRLRRRLRGQARRPGDGGRAPLELGAARPLRHDARAHRGGPCPPAPGRHAPWLASTVMKVSIVNASNARLLRAAMRSFPPADRTILTEWGPPDHALGFVREAMRQGTEGCVQDYRIFGDPWGFALEEIAVPVQIWEGSDDRTGPPGYRDLPAGATSRTPPSRSSRARGTCPCCPIRRPPSSPRCSAATTAPSRRRGGTSGRRRSPTAGAPGIAPSEPHASGAGPWRGSASTGATARPSW